MICDNDDDDTHPIWELNAREHLERAGWKREKGRASCFLLIIMMIMMIIRIMMITMIMMIMIMVVIMVSQQIPAHQNANMVGIFLWVLVKIVEDGDDADW